MKIFGDVDRFAIQIDLFEDRVGPWLYGCACYRIAGMIVGDFDHSDTLRDLLNDYVWNILPFADKRQNPMFMEMESRKLLRLLNAVIAGSYRERVYDRYKKQADAEQWRRHDILPHPIVFQKSRVYLVENESVARCVFSCEPYKKAYECWLKPGEADAVIKEAVDYIQPILEYEYEQERLYGPREE